MTRHSQALAAAKHRLDELGRMRWEGPGLGLETLYRAIEREIAALKRHAPYQVGGVQWCRFDERPTPCDDIAPLLDEYAPAARNAPSPALGPVGQRVRFRDDHETYPGMVGTVTEVLDLGIGAVHLCVALDEVAVRADELEPASSSATPDPTADYEEKP